MAGCKTSPPRAPVGLTLTKSAVTDLDDRPHMAVPFRTSGAHNRVAQIGHPPFLLNCDGYIPHVPMAVLLSFSTQKGLVRTTE